MTYTVKKGDSLSIIARDQLNDLSRWPEIAALNNIKAPYTIYPDQTLTLPDLSSSDNPLIPLDQPKQDEPEQKSKSNVLVTIILTPVVVGGLLAIYKHYRNRNKKTKTSAT